MLRQDPQEEPTTKEEIWSELKPIDSILFN